MKSDTTESDVPSGMEEYVRVEVPSDLLVYGDLAWIDGAHNGLLVKAEWQPYSPDEVSMWITGGKFADPTNNFINKPERVARGFLSQSGLEIYPRTTPARPFLSLHDMLMFEKMWPRLWDAMRKEHRRRPLDRD